MVIEMKPKKKIELPLMEPLYSTYHHQGAATATLVNNPSIRNWYMNQVFILTCTRNFLSGFTTPQIGIADSSWSLNPYLEKKFFSMQILKGHTNYIIRNLLDEGYYVCFDGIDDYYIAGKSWYHKRHFVHDGCICGYDQENKTFSLYAYDQNWIYRKFLTPQKAFNEGRKAQLKNGQRGGICGFKPLATQITFSADIALGKIAEYFYKHKKDYEKTVKYAVPAAEQGDKLGELYLGICYYYGRGIDKNLEKAFALFKSAAEKDSGKALHWMGYLYENGIFVDKDLEKALKYYTEAADNGVLDVQVMLANRYYKGMHVTKDIEKAKHYYHLAALRESPEGMYGYGQCLYNALNSDDSEALYWFKKAADKGIASAMSAIAECYFSNRGQVEFFSEKKRYEAAIKWAKKAKEHGDSIADIRLERYERAIKQLEFNERKRAEAASLPTSSFSDCSSTVGSVDSMEYVKNNLPSVWTPGGIETVRNDPNLSESEKEEILDKYRIYSD